MKLQEILKRSAIAAELGATDKVGALKELASVAARLVDGLDAERLAQVLIDREHLGSTGIGEGIAIPHGKVSGLREIVAVFAKSRRGIDFQARDSRACHLFFLLLVPEASPGQHLKALARISRLAQSGEFRKGLLAADAADDLWALICAEDDRM